MPVDGGQTAEIAGGMQKQLYTPEPSHSALTQGDPVRKFVVVSSIRKPYLRGKKVKQNDTAF